MLDNTIVPPPFLCPYCGTSVTCFLERWVDDNGQHEIAQATFHYCAVPTSVSNKIKSQRLLLAAVHRAKLGEGEMMWNKLIAALL